MSALSCSVCSSVPLYYAPLKLDAGEGKSGPKLDVDASLIPPEKSDKRSLFEKQFLAIDGYIFLGKAKDEPAPPESSQ